MYKLQKVHIQKVHIQTPRQQGLFLPVKIIRCNYIYQHQMDDVVSETIIIIGQHHPSPNHQSAALTSYLELVMSVCPP